MRTILLPIIALASCGSGPISIDADRCWTLSIGDQVRGTAILNAYSGNMCIECGAYLTSSQCKETTAFATANEAVDQAYDDIIRATRSSKSGYIKRKVKLSGRVIVNGANGKPMVQATSLELAD